MAPKKRLQRSQSRQARRGRIRENSLEGLSFSLTGASPFSPFGVEQIVRGETLAAGNASMPVTLDRHLLASSYCSQGLVQTVIDQPVEDAFRGGIEIECDELGEDGMDELSRVMKHRVAGAGGSGGNRISRRRFLSGADAGASDFEAVASALCWARLFGGAGLIINTDQNPAEEFEPESLGEGAPLQFIAADRWELILALMLADTPFNYYGVPLHRSRVLTAMGKEAPSFLRPRLQGWGMSEIERCIRPINSFVKFETMLFELIDEAKIDVFKIEGFNAALASEEGTNATQRRVALANFLKNHQRAITMDATDDFIQKQIAFSGFGEIYEQLRLNLSSALKIPMNKLFGQSATGFGGGQDAIENYNAIVEGVRVKAEPLLRAVTGLRCRQLFGFLPDFEIKWKPLKILDGTQEEQVKDARQARILALKDRDLLSGREAMLSLQKEGIYKHGSEVGDGLREPAPGSFAPDGGQGGGGQGGGEDMGLEKRREAA
ncbi:MAG: DUF1073 domain-containing protein [Opitutaceae bacterium]|nr:DUF1073 domain-containing protein [Opitutaceae bacterium]